jgi:hypothetical protein
VVKGATLFALWSGHPHRPTRDLDLLGLGEENSAVARGVFQEICRAAVPDDGLVFDADSVSVEPLRAGTDFQGLRVGVRARLGTARIPMQIDIGFGDAVTPPAEEAEFPVLLGFPAPRLLFYRRETVVAEKFEAMVTRGIANSRMKDFFDIWFLARNFAFEGPALVESLGGTMKQRGVSFGHPIAFTREFFDDTGKVSQWKVFLRRSGLEKEAPALSDVCLHNERFLMPPARAAVAGKGFDQSWPAGGPWRPMGKRDGEPGGR